MELFGSLSSTQLLFRKKFELRCVKETCMKIPIKHSHMSGTIHTHREMNDLSVFYFILSSSYSLQNLSNRLKIEWQSFNHFTIDFMLFSFSLFSINLSFSLSISLSISISIKNDLFRFSILFLKRDQRRHRLSIFNIDQRRHKLSIFSLIFSIDRRRSRLLHIQFNKLDFERDEDSRLNSFFFEASELHWNYFERRETTKTTTKKDDETIKRWNDNMKYSNVWMKFLRLFEASKRADYRMKRRCGKFLWLRKQIWWFSHRSMFPSANFQKSDNPFAGECISSCIIY